MPQDRHETWPCEVCGVLVKTWVADPDARCLCAQSRAKARAALQMVDPGERMTLVNWTPASERMGKIKRAAERIAAGDKRRGLFLSGDPGIGKTHLMVGVVREALRVGRIARWENMADLVRRVQASYGDPEAPDRQTVVEGICRHQLVVLDDVGKERNTEDTQLLLYELVDGLYRQRRTLLIATNLDQVAFARRVDGAVRSRLDEMCHKLAVEGEDQRRRMGATYGK